jgi:hypothetical protein
MRLLHPKTIKTASEKDDMPKTILSHCWAECFKAIKSGQKHPKMFIYDRYHFGTYMRLVYEAGITKGCNLDKDKVQSLGFDIQRGFDDGKVRLLDQYFDDIYLFSDCVSLYMKGVNIIKYIFVDWRKYIPIESHKEMHRVISKYLSK